MIKAGDTLLLGKFSFKVLKIKQNWVSLCFTDKHGVTHIRTLKLKTFFAKLDFTSKAG